MNNVVLLAKVAKELRVPSVRTAVETDKTPQSARVPQVVKKAH